MQVSGPPSRYAGSRLWIPAFAGMTEGGRIRLEPMAFPGPVSRGPPLVIPAKAGIHIRIPIPASVGTRGL